MDISHVYGGYLSVDGSGNLVMASGTQETDQRIFRRALTNPIGNGIPPDYIAQPEYGMGLGRLVGQPVTLEALNAIFVQQMGYEADVDPSVPPKLTLVRSADGTVNTLGISYQSVGTGTLIQSLYISDGG